ncbi:MAG: alanine/glycine:cation symporter family protein [Myxococcota bacterium]
MSPRSPLRCLILLLATFITLAAPIEADRGWFGGLPSARAQAPEPAAPGGLPTSRGATAPRPDEMAPPPPDAAPPTKPERNALAAFNHAMETALFFDVLGGSVTMDEVDREGAVVRDEAGVPVQKTVGFPFLVMVLALGAMFFTVFYRFINLRAFKHAIDIVRGRYDNPDDDGEISHFRALTSALSATVGLGNIAGVAVAIVRGGPGAVVWMMIVAVFGMSLKFQSCTLANLYRKKNEDGSISGGPMYYLDLGLRRMGGPAAKFGKALALIYAVMVMGGAFGGGNMFQANQTVEALTTSFGMTVQDAAGNTVPDPTAAWAIGIVMAIFVGAVIFGGIKRIGAATSRIVPFMVALYVGASMFVIVVNAAKLPAAIALMFEMAFTENAFYGGLLGVLVQGVQRAAFSNEAGLGSASIAHAAAKTDEPVREGMVAMLEPFIDTIVVCFMTAMVVIVTGQWNAPDVVNAQNLQGASVTAGAFESVISWFPEVLSISIALFAYSTQVSWCYYGERGWIYLLDHFNGAGLRSVFVFRLIFVAFVVVGATNQLGDVLAFSDIMILSMAFPNIIGCTLLAPHLRERLEDYWARYQRGSFKTYD